MNKINEKSYTTVLCAQSIVQDCENPNMSIREKYIKIDGKQQHQQRTRDVDNKQIKSFKNGISNDIYVNEWKMKDISIHKKAQILYNTIHAA